MDFKAILSKLDGMEAPPTTPAAPVLDKAVQLNEDAQLRVLAGQTTYVAEAKKKKEEDVKEEKSSTGGTIDRSTKGVTKHKENPNRFSDEPHTEPKSQAKSQSAADKAADKAAAKAHDKDSKDYEKKYGKGSVTRVKDGKKVESVEPEFKSKFMKMVEAKKEEADKKKADKKKKMEESSKPDFLDLDKDGNKKEPMKKAAKDSKKTNEDAGDQGYYTFLIAKSKKGPNALSKQEKEKLASYLRAKKMMDEDQNENIDSDEAGFYVVDEDGNVVSGPFDSKQEAYERAAEKGRMYDVKYKGDVIPTSNLIQKIIQVLPPDVRSDDITDPMDLEHYLRKNPLGRVFGSLSPREQARVTDEVANYFYGKNSSAFGDLDEGKSSNKSKKDYDVNKMAEQKKFSGKKKTVKESIESNLSFKEMMALVVESGGQQQIDPIDNQLWAWAQRVARTKIGEGMKADVYAGMVYERMGGTFEMYDVLSEQRR